MASSSYSNNHYWAIDAHVKDSKTRLFDIDARNETGFIRIYSYQYNDNSYTVDEIKELINCLQHAVSIASPKKEERISDLVTGLILSHPVFDEKPKEATL